MTIYIILGIVAALMLSATLCTVFKAGARDDICKYEREED